MNKVAIMTDSNSGITQLQGKEMGVHVLAMPFTINGQTFYEDINLSQDEFYKRLEEDSDIATSQPIVGDVIDIWNELLKEYDEVVHIPMSSGLSSSCETAIMLSQEFDGRVQVVDNQRISVTLRQSVLDAVRLSKEGVNAVRIKDLLEGQRRDSSIYIMVDTLKYLKKGGRVTPAAAAIGTILNLKPVLQIQGDKLDAFSKARNVKHAKRIMIDAMKKDMQEKFSHLVEAGTMKLAIAYTFDQEAADEFKAEVTEHFPGYEIVIAPLSLSVACHIGTGAIALACANETFF